MPPRVALISSPPCARDSEVLALPQIGAAELLLGHGAAARQAYSQARHQALEIGVPLQHEASAGLARVALAEDDTAAALAALQPLLDHVVTGGTFSDTEERLIELTCHQALARAGDPRAADWRARAHTALMNGAATITDAAPGDQRLLEARQRRLLARPGQLMASSSRFPSTRSGVPSPCVNAA